MADTDNKFGAQFDEVAAGYDFMETIFNNNEWFLSKMPAGRGRALDVGCGSGIMAEKLARRFAEVDGIDISENMLEIARARRNLPNIHYALSDARDFEPRQEYDYIASRTTFHHIDDIPALVEKLKTALRPGGRLAVLDCVCAVETPPRFHFIAGAFMELPLNVVRIGPGAAWKIFRFRLSEPWLEHLAHDKYLSESRFMEVFGGALPGCAFEKVQSFMGVVWEKPG